MSRQGLAVGLLSCFQRGAWRNGADRIGLGLPLAIFFSLSIWGCVACNAAEVLRESNSPF